MKNTLNNLFKLALAPTISQLIINPRGIDLDLVDRLIKKEALKKTKLGKILYKKEKYE